MSYVVNPHSSPKKCILLSSRDTDGETEAHGAKVTAYGHPAGTWWNHCVLLIQINDTCAKGIQSVKIVFKMPRLSFWKKNYKWQNLRLE